MLFSERHEVFPDWAVEEARNLLMRQAKVFPLGSTWVGREYGVHTLWARVDCVIHGDRLLCYEGEDRPDGVGSVRCINPAFAARLDEVRAEWPSFRWVRSSNRHTDDELWLGPGLALEEALASRDLLLVRARPEDSAYHPLEDRAIAPVSHEGCKRYGVALDWWQVLSWNSDTNEPDHVPTVSSVIKPIQGTRGRAINLYLFEPELSGLDVPKGVLISRGELRRRVRKEKEVVCQPFIPAMRLPDLPDRHAILRMYFGFSPRTCSFVPLGGVWMATPDPIVHGKEGAVVGPLVLS